MIIDQNNNAWTKVILRDLKDEDRRWFWNWYCNIHHVLRLENTSGEIRCLFLFSLFFCLRKLPDWSRNTCMGKKKKNLFLHLLLPSLIKYNKILFMCEAGWNAAFYGQVRSKWNLYIIRFYVKIDSCIWMLYKSAWKVELHCFHQVCGDLLVRLSLKF